LEEIRSSNTLAAVIIFNHLALFKREFREMRKLYLILALVFLLLFAAPVRAQNIPKFNSMEVDLWPEYDRPGVLVIYRITLSADTSLPAELRIPIPSSAGEPSAVAAKQVDGTLINMAYTRQVVGQWSEIQFTAALPDIQIEYYDTRLMKQGQSRHFDYYWPGGFAVAALTIQVQQPVGSSGMRISPNLGAGQAGSDGLIYYTAQVGSLSSAQSFKITLDYQRSSDALSAESLPVNPTRPLTDATSGRIQLFSGTNTLLAVLGLVLIGVVLIAGGGYWYWQSGHGKEEPGMQQRRLRGNREEAAIENGTGEVIYCHQCGNRAGPGDRYCRVCGVKLRVE
jgi:hypothetical protein